MKRSLISLSMAALATASIASAQPGGTEEGAFDRTPPTYPEFDFATAATTRATPSGSSPAALEPAAQLFFQRARLRA